MFSPQNSFLLHQLVLSSLHDLYYSSVIPNSNYYIIANFTLAYKQDAGGITEEQIRRLDTKAKSARHFSLIFTARAGPRKSLEK